MEFLKDADLRKLNTFGVNARAAYFAEVKSIDDLIAVREEMLKNPVESFMVLGGGSNVLFKEDYPGLVLRMMIPGMDIFHEDADSYVVKAGAGEVWHSFIVRLLDAGIAGLENLALIPGTVGAAPIQNIGAYGAEAAERIESVEVFDINSGEIRELTTEECDFGYRSSIFKKKENHHLIITGVTFRFPKKWQPNIGYKALAEEIEINRFPELRPEDVFSCVVALRRRKLPDPSKVGNAGSFFKNPTVERDLFSKLLRTSPSVVSYPLAGGKYKLSAAWLIEQAGLRGYRMGDVGVWEKQPLVLVNYGHATGEDIYALAQDVRLRVKNCFSIKLEPEVNII